MTPAGAADAVNVFHADHAWLGGELVARDVQIVTSGERITQVLAGAPRAARAVRLRGLTLPAFANTHSHAFHRALRGRTHGGRGDFWSWREQMYAVAERLTPETYYALARATYAEMALAGISCVGEFHYLHHDHGGARYGDANAMGAALIAAARDAGIRITLLDTCYLAGGFGVALEGPQLRFGDGDVLAWGERAAQLQSAGHARIGAAIHSVRAVPAEQLAPVREWADARRAPLHFHVSEQPAENQACLATHGVTPVALLDAQGVLSERACAVHATHLDAPAIELLGQSRTTVCMCPTTERDLADGIGPARALADAGAPLALGSDSNAVIDMFEEARALELDERLASRRRGNWRLPELLAAAGEAGHASLGWPEAGRIAPGALADLVTISLDSVRLAGGGAEQPLGAALFAASAADVNELIVGGRRVVADGRHLLVDGVAAALREAITALSS